MPPPEHLQEALDALQQFAGPSGSALYAAPKELPTSVRLCQIVWASRTARATVGLVSHLGECSAENGRRVSGRHGPQRWVLRNLRAPAENDVRLLGQGEVVVAPRCEQVGEKPKPVAAAVAAAAKRSAAQSAATRARVGN